MSWPNRDHDSACRTLKRVCSHCLFVHHPPTQCTCVQTHSHGTNTNSHNSPTCAFVIPFNPQTSSDDITFTAAIPLPPPGSYAAGVDFYSGLANFVECSGEINEDLAWTMPMTTTSAPVVSTTSGDQPESSPAPTEAQPDDELLADFVGNVQFVLNVPRDPLAGSAMWAAVRPEVAPNVNTPVQSVVVSPIAAHGDTHMVVDRQAQEECCVTKAGCTAVSLVLTDAGAPGTGCIAMQFALTDRFSGAGLPAEIYLAAPTHIALARRGVTGAPPVELSHIHGQWGTVSEVGSNCQPTHRAAMANMGGMRRSAPDGVAQAVVWATAEVDPLAEYKVCRDQ